MATPDNRADASNPCCPAEDRGWRPCGPDCDTYDTDPA